MKPIFIGIDIGGTKILGGLVSGEGEVYETIKVPTPKRVQNEELERLINEVIHALTSSTFAKKAKVSGIGLGLPGLIDQPSGTLITAPNLGVEEFKVKAPLAKKWNLPVELGNDVNLGLLGEQWLGAAKGFQHVLGIFPGTGIGGGIILNGKNYAGAHGAGGEIGHMQMDLKGPKCNCGNIGCLEAFAGRWAIERDIRRALDKGAKSILSKSVSSAKSRIKSSALKKAIAKKDALALEVLQQASVVLGQAVVSLRHVFDPEMVVFGGGLIEACGDFILPIVEKRVRKDPLFKSLPACEIVPAELKDDSVLLGAVRLIQTT